MASLISGRMIAAQALNKKAQATMNHDASIQNSKQSPEQEGDTTIDDIMWGNIDIAVSKRDGQMLRRVLNPMGEMKKVNSDVASDVKNLSKRTSGVNG